MILLRLMGLAQRNKTDLVIETFIKNHKEFRNAYSVLSSKKLRIRKYTNIGKL
jgi:hypothetical protein